VQAGRHLWEVYNEAGEAIGIITVPREFDVLRANTTSIWGRSEDSLGVPYVRKYQIRGAPN
jgi:hypothetical protein